MVQELQSNPTAMHSDSGYSLGSIQGILADTTLPGDDAALHRVVSGANGVLCGANGVIGMNGVIEGSSLTSHHSQLQHTGGFSGLSGSVQSGSVPLLNPSSASSFNAGTSGVLSGALSSRISAGASGSTAAGTSRVLAAGSAVSHAADQNVSARMPPINENSALKDSGAAHVPAVNFGAVKNGVNFRKLSSSHSNSNSASISRELGGGSGGPMEGGGAADSASFLGASGMASSAWTISGGGDIHGAVDSHFYDSRALLDASSAPAPRGDGAINARMHGARRLGTGPKHCVSALRFLVNSR